MRRHSSWRLANPRELAEVQARAQQRPRGRVRVLVAQATNIGMAGPLLACNPKSAYDDGITIGPPDSITLGQETTGDWGDGDGDNDSDGDDDWGGPPLDILGEGDGDGDGDGFDLCPPLPPPDRGSQALLESNIARANLDVWLDPQDGESSAIDAGVLLDPGLCDDDLDGELRIDAPDLGADEVSH